MCDRGMDVQSHQSMVLLSKEIKLSAPKIQNGYSAWPVR